MPAGIKIGSSPAVREFLSGRAGQDVYLSELVQKLPYSVNQIRAAINHRIHAGDPIIRVITGQCWRWTAEPAGPTPSAVAGSADRLILMKVVGTLNGGDLLLQDTEAGTLFRCQGL